MTEELQMIRVQDRRIIEGPVDKLVQVSPVKYQKPMQILERMMRNNWMPWDINIAPDVEDYRRLDRLQQLCVQKALGFLSNVDGIQLKTLAECIGSHVTSPEYGMALVRQTYEEEVHVLTYSRMIEALEMDPVETYNLFMTDDILRHKNQAIIAQAEAVGKNFSPENFVVALAANQALEGIYFNMGFTVFYALARMGRMLNVAQNIAYINRDELVHLQLFNAMWHDLKAERPEAFTPEVIERCRAVMRDAARMEATWGKHIIQNCLPSLTNENIDARVETLSNRYCDAMEIQRVFPERRHDPLAWADEWAHAKESNFFESKPIEYDDKPLDWD